MTKSELLKAAKPILFNTEMVRAIQDGRKTVTRRVIKNIDTQDIEVDVDGSIVGFHDRFEGSVFPVTNYAPYRKGDILYVRETWRKDVGRYMYKANYSDTEKFYQGDIEVEIKWKPSIHMPKSAARIFLKVTDVRVERLQDINTKGIRAEGIYECFMCCNENCETKTLDKVLCGDTWISLWNSTIKKQDIKRYGWNANPWVWVYEFEKLEVENG